MAAKMMAAGVKAAWEAAKKDFTETQSADDFKQDVIDALDFARSKAAMVKRNANSSSKSSSSGAGFKAGPRVNQDVGAELLTHFKDEWGSIHCSVEAASQVATKMESDYQSLNTSMTKSHMVIERCRDEFACLREIVEVLDEAQTKVNEIGKLVEQVENAIQDYSQVKAELNSERRKHSLKKQHEKMLEESKSKVEQMKKVFTNEQALSLHLKEDMENKELRERQDAFQEIFDKQMSDYRQKGKVDAPIDEVKLQRSASQLDDMMIEDEDGTASLHEFLGDVIIDQSESSPPEEAKPSEDVEDTPILSTDSLPEV